MTEHEEDDSPPEARDIAEASVLLHKLLKMYSGGEGPRQGDRPRQVEDLDEDEEDDIHRAYQPSRKRGSVPLSVNQDVWQLAEMMRRRPVEQRQRERAKNILERFGKRSIPDDISLREILEHQPASSERRSRGSLRSYGHQ